MPSTLRVNKHAFDVYKVTQENINAIAMHWHLKGTLDSIQFAKEIEKLKPYWISKPEIVFTEEGFAIEELKQNSIKSFNFPFETIDQIYVANCVFPNTISHFPFKCPLSKKYYSVTNYNDELYVVHQYPRPDTVCSTYLVMDV